MREVAENMRKVIVVSYNQDDAFFGIEEILSDGSLHKRSVSLHLPSEKGKHQNLALLKGAAFREKLSDLFSMYGHRIDLVAFRQPYEKDDVLWEIEHVLLANCNNSKIPLLSIPALDVDAYTEGSHSRGYEQKELDKLWGVLDALEVGIFNWRGI